MEQRPEHSGRQGIVADDRSTAAGPVRRLLSAALVAVGLFLAGYTVVVLLWMAFGTVGLIVAICLLVVAFLIAAARWQRFRFPVTIALIALAPPVVIFLNVSINGLLPAS